MSSVEYFEMPMPTQNLDLLDFERTNHFFFKKLTYFIAAEINDPIAIIHAQVQDLQAQLSQGTTTSASLNIGLQRIFTSNNRINKITKMLRVLSESSSARPPRESIFLRQIITDTLDICQNRLLQHQFQIFQSVDPKLIVNVRGPEISQILLHLIENSIQANQAKPNPWLQIEATRQGNNAVLAFWDSGQGISSEIMESALRPVRLKSKGLFRGLSISAFLAQQNNGQLHIEKHEDNTRLVLSLPLA